MISTRSCFCESIFTVSTAPSTGVSFTNIVPSISQIISFRFGILTHILFNYTVPHGDTSIMKLRKSVVAFFIKQDGNDRYFLIVHKSSRQILDWGLPAGGRKNNESTLATFTREMSEELNLKEGDYKLLSVEPKIIHSYLWGKDMKSLTGFDGQMQELVCARLEIDKMTLGEELDGYCWVKFNDAENAPMPADLKQLIIEKIIYVV